jgi:ADP-ribosyl-[dinitrogen reductase] hydrolase
MAANLGEDADTTPAITGQLAGALHGAAGIPDHRVGRVVWGDQIIAKAVNLLRKVGSELKGPASSP